MTLQNTNLDLDGIGCRPLRRRIRRVSEFLCLGICRIIVYHPTPLISSISYAELLLPTIKYFTQSLLNDCKLVCILIVPFPSRNPFVILCGFHPCSSCTNSFLLVITLISSHAFPFSPISTSPFHTFFDCSVLGVPVTIGHL